MPLPRRSGDVQLCQRVSARWMCVFCLNNRWSAAPCGSRPSVAARSCAIYVQPSVCVDERTLDESSWRSDMWWRYALSGDYACYLSDRPMLLPAMNAGSQFLLVVRECTGEYLEKALFMRIVLCNIIACELIMVMSKRKAGTKLLLPLGFNSLKVQED